MVSFVNEKVFFVEMAAMCREIEIRPLRAGLGGGRFFNCYTFQETLRIAPRHISGQQLSHALRYPLFPRYPLNPPAHHVMQSPGCIQSRLSWHAPSYTFPYPMSKIISLCTNVTTFLLIFKLAFSIPQSAFGIPHFPISLSYYLPPFPHAFSTMS